MHKGTVKLQQRKWVIDQSCSMLYACSSPAVVTASDGLFLVVVGCRNGDRNARVQLFQVNNKKWYNLSTIECGDKIYVIETAGKGYWCSLKASLLSGDDLASHVISWKYVPLLPVTSSTATTLCGQLILIGGSRQGSLVSTIYQLVDDNWINIGSIRSLCLVSSFQDKVLIVGGSKEDGSGHFV